MKNDNDEPNFFDVDQNRLDWEWVRQPKLFHEHAVLAADTRRELEMAEAGEKMVRAEVSLEVRRDPAGHGLEKVTEDAIKSTVEIDPRMMKAVTGAIEARHAADVARAAVQTLDHKKSALENLVKLQNADYFSEPKSPPESRDRLGKAKRDGAFGRAKR